MKMRDLETRTGVNRETIRVYLRHGLVPEPIRPKPNVADYDDSHVRAVLAVRQLQRDNGLTLRQIKEVLSGESGERRVEAAAFQNLETLVAASMGQSGQPVLLASLARSWPHAEKDANELARIGVLEIVETPGGPALSVTDARLVTLWGEMRAAGFTEELGFSPDILTFYAEPVSHIAREEATGFFTRVEGRIGEEQAASMLPIALRLMLDFIGLIRMKAFLGHVQQFRAASQKDAIAAE